MQNIEQKKANYTHIILINVNIEKNLHAMVL